MDSNEKAADDIYAIYQRLRDKHILQGDAVLMACAAVHLKINHPSEVDTMTMPNCGLEPGMWIVGINRIIEEILPPDSNHKDFVMARCRDGHTIYWLPNSTTNIKSINGVPLLFPKE
jgi:hypothetical protein